MTMLDAIRHRDTPPLRADRLAASGVIDIAIRRRRCRATWLFVLGLWIAFGVALASRVWCCS